MQESKNCELLFEYLRSILYDAKIETLNIFDLDEPYRKLGQGLQFLENAIGEMKSYSEALSHGNLSVDTPPRDNFLCENLKNIHANLNHLTWQAKQVAKGDYAQTVSYLGEFSEAFNTMTGQLHEREVSLKEEATREKAHANMLESYNQLLMQLIDRSNEDILVTSVDHQEILYRHQRTSGDTLSNELYALCIRHLAEKNADPFQGEQAYEWIWETEDSLHCFYRITTGLMEWQGQKAYAHIIQDITEKKQRKQKLTAEAYHDSLTGIGNRQFLIEQMGELLNSKRQLTFCYCDLDHLKYINDTYGHLEGDWYICHFVHTMKKFIRKEDILARIGGDEFCLVLEGLPGTIARERLIDIQNAFDHTKEKPYPKGFSFGIIEIPANHDELTVNDVIRQADYAMYQQKELHKQAYAPFLT